MEEYQRRMEACFKTLVNWVGGFSYPCYPSSHTHGSVENYSKLKDTNIGDTPIFHWTMIMGGRVYHIDFSCSPLIVEMINDSI